jgi:hypothetical protein
VNMDSMIVALIEKVNDFNRNPLLTTTTTYEGLNGSLKEMQDTFRDFRLNPKKYLRLKIF